MRTPIIAGNWKMNNTIAATKALVTELIPLVKDAKAEVVICTPYTDLATAVELTKGTNIKVGAENITMQVNAVDLYYYEGRLFRMLQVSDENDIFSGTIVCGIGHLISFFPERLMTRDKGYRVEGMRCYWRDGELVFKYGDKDCDAVYKDYHFGLDDNEDDMFAVYPNPTHSVLFVETRHGTSLPDQTYRITNLMGQNLLIGQITAETEQIDVSALPEGMYFITFAGETHKFMVQ